MFSRHAIKPAFNTAGQQEVVFMDRQNASALDYALIQPGWQSDRHAKGLSVAILERVPVIEP